MYQIRRVYGTKPGEAPKVAKVAKPPVKEASSLSPTTDTPFPVKPIS